MKAILKRELRSYFTTPIGYIYLGVYLAVSGAVFCYTTLYRMSADVTTYFTVMLYVLALLLPILTMKTFAEEKRQRTEQLLLTAPVSLTGMVLGKFLAAFLLFFASHTFSSLYFLLLLKYANLKIALLLGNYFAVLLCGASFIAIGLFASALTENQLAAAIGTIGILAVFLVLSLLASFFSGYAIRYVLECFSLFSRFSGFTNGIFDFAALIYYLSVTAVFLFFTVRVFDRRRYV